MRTRKEIESDLEKLDMELFLVNLKRGLKGIYCENDSEEMDIYYKYTELNLEMSKLDWFGNE